MPSVLALLHRPYFLFWLPGTCQTSVPRLEPAVLVTLGSHYEQICHHGWLLHAVPGESLPPAWMARPQLRVLPRQQRLHLPGSGEWPRVPDGPCIRIREPGPGKRSHACFYGLPELFSQWRHACPQRDRPGAACRRQQRSQVSEEQPAPPVYKPPQVWTPLQQQFDHLFGVIPRGAAFPRGGSRVDVGIR